MGPGGRRGRETREGEELQVLTDYYNTVVSALLTVYRHVALILYAIQTSAESVRARKYRARCK